MQRQRSKCKDDDDDDEAGKKEDTVGKCHVNQCPPVHSTILDIVY